MTIQQYGDGTELVWLPDGSQLITTELELAADDEISFSIDITAGALSINHSDSVTVAESVSLRGLIVVGSTCWGHDTSVDEDNVLDFTGKWTGDGEISGSGDAEIMELGGVGKYMESEVVNIGAVSVEIEVNKYIGSPVGTVKYKDGSSAENCEADTWSEYSSAFDSAGYVKIRVEA